MIPLEPEAYRDLVRQALAEDVGTGDVTSAAIVPVDLRATATLTARGDCVVAGIPVAAEVFRVLDSGAETTALIEDGVRCKVNQPIASVRGSARALLSGERTALNFVQRLSGIATLTRRFVDATSGRTAILDTRKTTPGLRALEKYAVRCGGGTNHRFGLYDAVLIKDNHIEIAGGIREAVQHVRDQMVAGWPVPVEVEAQSLAAVDEALAARADTIMLDNLSIDEMREAIGRIAGRARVEISGGVTLASLPALATLGADMISIGALTHSAPAVDISMEITPDATRSAS